MLYGARFTKILLITKTTVGIAHQIGDQELMQAATSLLTNLQNAAGELKFVPPDLVSVKVSKVQPPI